MFMTWTNFDCMDVLPVSGFQGFSRSLESEALKEREKYDSRQKLFLYPVSAEQGLLSPENAEGLPLIMLTVLDLEKPPHIDTASYKEILMDAMQKETVQSFMKGIQETICALVKDPVNANTGNFIY